MDDNNHGGRVLAILAGLGFTVGTCLVLFDDVLLDGANITIKHLLTLIIIACTIMVGHLASNAMRTPRQWGSVLGFALLFIAGTGLVVLTSVGRQGEAQMMTAAQVEQAADLRRSTKAKLAEAEAMKAQAQVAMERECASGKGKRCLGREATLNVYTAAVAGHMATLERLGPPKPAAPEAEKLAEIAAVFGANKEKVKAGTILAKPFFQALFLEFGAIISFGFGFRPNKRKHRLQPKPQPVPEPANVARREDQRAGKLYSVPITEKDSSQTSFPDDARDRPALRLAGLINHPKEWAYCPQR